MTNTSLVRAAVATTVSLMFSVSASAQLRDGTYKGRLVCGSVLGEQFEAARKVDDVVQLVVVGKFLTWSRTTREYQETAQSTIVDGSMEIDARGAYKSEFGSRRPWRMRGTIVQTQSELRGALTQTYFSGGRRDCEVVIPITPSAVLQNAPSGTPEIPNSEKAVDIESAASASDSKNVHRDVRRSAQRPQDQFSGSADKGIAPSAKITTKPVDDWLNSLRSTNTPRVYAYMVIAYHEAFVKTAASQSGECANAAAKEFNWTKIGEKSATSMIRYLGEQDFGWWATVDVLKSSFYRLQTACPQAFSKVLRSQ